MSSRFFFEVHHPLMMTRLFLFSLCFFSFLGVLHAQHQLPDVMLSKEITRADHQSYTTIAFEVPSGIERLSIETEYSQKEQKTVIDLGLIDPQGKIVGWSGGNKSRFTLSAIDATPSYSPHAIDPGQWQLLLGIPNIREGVRATFQAKIYFSRSLISSNDPPWVNPSLNPQARWYRGDLHLHSAHSDGSCQNASTTQEVPCPAFVIAQKAHALKLDFIALSDHNAVSQANTLRELQPFFDNLLLMPARELTSFYGHANLLGSTQPFDFRALDPKTGWVEGLKAFKSAPTHTFTSINHPHYPSGELCMGCGWTFDTSLLDEGLIQGVEVANGEDNGSIFSGLPFWLKHLEQGRRLTAVAGSDNHHADQDEKTRNYLGRPTNVVYAKALSTQAITTALMQGHAYIDFASQGDSTPKRQIELAATFNHQTFMMGDSIEIGEGAQDVAIHLRLLNAQGARARLHTSPLLLAPTEMGLIEHAMELKEFKITPQSGHSWFFLELYDETGRLNLMTNPIYFDKK